MTRQKITQNIVQFLFYFFILISIWKLSKNE